MLLQKIGHCLTVAPIVPILFKERLKTWRGLRRQKEAAAALNVPVGTYRKWEYGKRTPKTYLIPVYEQKMSDNPDATKILVRR